MLHLNKCVYRLADASIGIWKSEKKSANLVQDL